MVSSRDAGHHRGRVGLHPTPCTEQPFNRDLRIPAVCLSGFLLSVSPQAIPARFTPAFWLSLVCSCPGGTSPESYIGLSSAASDVYKRQVVKEHWFSILELEKARFARYFQNLYRFFAVSQIGIRKGSFIYNFLKFSKFHSPTRREHCGCEMNFHQANHQKRTVLYEGMGSRIPIKMPGMKSPNGILSYSGRILP